MNSEKGQRRTLVGVVTSDKMDKGVVVLVRRRFRHPIYGKYVLRHKKYMAHDPANDCRSGDTVMIEEHRPVSRRKRWRVKQILERAV
ncbi:30S ribosomal protein S17 [Dissulfurirhabdus thermomarina]|uniref:Small ribosomal subunit protein uS17 n=1 Tax=Dissulfurirhabdus thermomarina TaxID=1765737 RepID=A0A6N9TPF5_DISTH|nr:30S ribosomal protein S17 [Dissulfurirhabdus thermomarina]NDY41317.1 30S ribosomal protein S17 [Dissulfurirhabdus thermomarina]NMX23300.1 30S ribosomal protein S17 [Dissulfurirhabdus thermomarina]